MAVRLAALITHPIQYTAPMLRLLAAAPAIDLHVFYGWRGATAGAFDPGFGRRIAWDIPLLEGYPYTFLENVSSDPGSHHFNGIDCPGAAEAIFAWQPDLLLLYGWPYRTHLRVLRACRGRLPVLFRGDSTLLDERPGPRRLLRRAFLRWIYSQVEAALYAGSNSRDYFRAHGLRDEQLFFVPHAVDNARFAEDLPTVREQAVRRRSELGIAPDATVFLFAGKLEERKDPGTLVSAFAQLGDPTVHLVLVGSGPLESSLRAMPVPRFHFAGFWNQSEMPAAYRMSDALVLPSRWGETWGLVLNEAMAAGLPVGASSKVGAARDLILPGENGFVFAPGDVVGLAGILRELAAAPHRRAAMGRRSQEIIAPWSLERQAAAIQDAAEQVVARWRSKRRQASPRSR